MPTWEWSGLWAPPPTAFAWEVIALTQNILGGGTDTPRNSAGFLVSLLEDPELSQTSASRVALLCF